MADPTIGLTLADYQIRVAEFLGFAYLGADGLGIAQVPVNAHDLDLATRLVNDGYDRFMQENERWNFLNAPLSLTLNSNAVTGMATSGSVTTLVDSSLASVYADNFFNGWQMTITHADTSADEVVITAYTGLTGTFTFATANESTVVGDQYSVMNVPNVFGQSWRMYLPDDFYGVLITPWTYNIGGPRLTVNTVSEITVRELRAGANTSGTVSTAAHRPIRTSAASTGERWEVMFWPSPATTNTLTAVYKRWPQKLALSTDRSIAGPQHDRTVLAAAIAEAERQRGDSLGPREQEYQAALARSRKLDARAYTVRATEYGDRSEDRAAFGRRPLNYFGADTYGGVRIP